MTLMLPIDGSDDDLRPLPVPAPDEALLEAFGREPWEKQQNETAREYAMFSCYRDLHPLDRSIRAAYRLYIETIAPHSTDRDPAKGRSPSWFSTIATTKAWASRVEAYDLHTDAQMRKQLEKDRIDSISASTRIGKLLRERAEEALTALLAVETRVVKDPITGAEETVLVSSLSPSAIVKLADAGIRIERQSLGMEDLPPAGTTVNVAVFQGTPDSNTRSSLEDRVRESLAARDALEGSYTEGAVPAGGDEGG